MDTSCALQSVSHLRPDIATQVFENWSGGKAFLQMNEFLAMCNVSQSVAVGEGSSEE